ncbi:unnamed protein product [Blepharisma stoltei]|uniref:ATP synthase F0 subunit 8 n=1 Tax=Blepharisma stoltei TaxID=1481888 RepID=A0AAU9JMZ2_9CILI|nr:unnamed protein product [Blepharisma stoltei]
MIDSLTFWVTLVLILIPIIYLIFSRLKKPETLSEDLTSTFASLQKSRREILHDLEWAKKSQNSSKISELQSQLKSIDMDISNLFLSASLKKAN